MLVIRAKEVIRCRDTYLYKFKCPTCGEECLTGRESVFCTHCGWDDKVAFDTRWAFKRNIVAVPDLKRRKQIGKKAVQKIFLDQEGRCAYCDCDLGQGYEVEHVLPITAGGTNQLCNLVLSCKVCNATARNLVFSNFSTKQHYILNNRKPIEVGA